MSCWGFAGPDEVFAAGILVGAAVALVGNYLGRRR